MQKRTAYLYFALGLVTGLALLSTTIIGNFDGPLRGPGDIESYGHMAFLFSRLLHWFPVPHLQFHTDLVAYPYGILSFPQVWCFEKEYFSLALTALAGDGPWIQLYVLFSFSITAIGSFLMLIRYDSYCRALLASLSISVLNFYCWHKYPGHINFVSVHWTALNLVADFLLCRMIVERRELSLRFLILRILLLILALGQDLGAVAGYALLSFTLSMLYLFLFQRHWIWNERHQWFSNWKIECRVYRFSVAGLTAIVLLFCYLYLPLVIQLTYYFKKYAAFNPGTYWANPIRLFIPWLPFLNPATPFFARVIADKPEALGALSPGWTLLIPAVIGIGIIWRRKLSYFLPLLSMLVLILLYQPKIFPTLKIFPWFQYMRASGRSSVVFSTLFTLLIFAIDGESFQPKVKRFLTYAWVCLLLGELWTSYFMLRPGGGLRSNLAFRTYMQRLKALPGEAVLDWPFCLHGGNFEVHDLCTDPERSEPVYAQQRFHNKKVVGLFFGRLSNGMVKPFSEAGWRFIFQRLNRQGKSGPCFKTDERDFFIHFFKSYDFVGVNLYPELLPTSCETEFDSLFGKPIFSTELPGVGRAEFFPRPHDWAVSGTVVGKELSYQPFLSQNVDLSVPVSLDDVEMENFESVPQDDGSYWFINSNRAAITFFLKQSVPVTLRLRMESELPGQTLSLDINGVTERALPLTSKATALQYRIEGKVGKNRVEFHLAKGGEWPEIVKLYVQQWGELGLLNLFSLQRFYNAHRRQAAKILELNLENRKP